MGYLHINNLGPKDARILEMREAWALEKVHGTSAHIAWAMKEKEPGNWDCQLTYFSGGASRDVFMSLFKESELRERFVKLGHHKVTIYGEAYGGKMQGMKDVYGPDLKFVAFDVRRVGDDEEGNGWFEVPVAHAIVEALGLEFVPYKRMSTDVEALNAERDRESDVAIRRGMGPGKIREGIVLRPIHELYDARGNRIICKHKGDAFNERVSTPKIERDPAYAQEMLEGEKVAAEFVTDMRMVHVLDHLKAAGMDIDDIRNTGKVVEAMAEDVLREGDGEIKVTEATGKAIRSAASKMYVKRCRSIPVPAAAPVLPPSADGNPYATADAVEAYNATLEEKKS